MTRAWSVSLMAAVALACTPKPAAKDPPECDQEPSQVSTDPEVAPPPAAWLGAVKVLETRDMKAGGAVRGTVAATFYDITNYRSESPSQIDLSPTCKGITGQTAQTGLDGGSATRAALAVDRVEVTGLQGGLVTLANPDGGSLSSTTTAAVLGPNPVTVSIFGADGGFVDVQFPALPAPSPVITSEPDMSGGTHLGDSDLRVRWQAGTNPDALVAIEMTSGAASVQTRGTVRCIVRDDGCHVVLAGALMWLANGGTDPITMVVKRNVSQAVLLPAPLDGGAVAVVTLSQEARGEVQP